MINKKATKKILQSWPLSYLNNMKTINSKVIPNSAGKFISTSYRWFGT
jgi:hypothetical protein